MKNTIKVLGIIVLAALIMGACDDPNGDNGNNGNNDKNGYANLTGNITINPSGSVTVGTLLTAVYTGTETVSFQWNRNGTPIQGATNTTHTPGIAGSYTVTVSATGFNSKTSAAVAVTPIPPLPGDVTIISDTGFTGDPLFADYDGDEDVSFQWNRDGTPIADADDDTFTPLEPGSYSVTASATGFLDKTSDPVTIELAPLPTLPGNVNIGSPPTVVAGTELTAFYSGSKDVSFHWNKDTIAIPGATGTTFTPTEAGSYTVTASATGFNPKTSSAVTVILVLSNFTFTPRENLVIGPGQPDYNGTWMFNIVGSFSNPVGGQGPFGYSLVTGDGSADNGRFSISGTNLTVGFSDLTEAREYKVRVEIREVNSPNQTFQKELAITVNWPPTGTPSAEISFNGIISGMLPNSENIGGMDVDTTLSWITLTNARLRNTVTVGTDVSSWFDPVFAELSYTIEDVYNSGESFDIKITGTPVTTSSAAVTITIPANVLVDNNTNPSITQGLVVSGNVSYNITVAPENVARIGSTHYQSIIQAISATTGTQEIIVTKSHEISSTITIGSGRTITIRAENDGITISRAEGFTGSIFHATGGFLNFGNGSGGAAGLHNPRLIIDGKGSGTLIQIGAGPIVNMWNGVELRNAATGVFIMGAFQQDGQFGMIGGVIAGCSTGVSAAQDAQFTMTGGIIYGNAEGANSNTVSVNRGTTRTGVTIFGTQLPAGQQTQTFGTAP